MNSAMWAIALLTAAALRSEEVAEVSVSGKISLKAEEHAEGVKRLRRDAKIAWARAALALGTRVDDDDIMDALRGVDTSDAFVQKFGKVKSALERYSDKGSAAAGPFSNQVVGGDAAAIGRLLGEGNWGQVYSAAEGDSVIKVDKRSHSLWAELLKSNPKRGTDRLRHEAEMLALAYKGGVRVPKPLSLGAIKLPGDEQHDVLVMQRAPGTSVQDRPLASLRGDAPRLAAEGIVQNVVRMLRAGLANPDQVAGNIFATDAGEVTFIDLGMARTAAELGGAFASVATKMVNNAFAVAPRPAVEAALRASSDAKALPAELQKVLHAAPSR